MNASEARALRKSSCRPWALWSMKRRAAAEIARQARDSSTDWEWFNLYGFCEDDVAEFVAHFEAKGHHCRGCDQMVCVSWREERPWDWDALENWKKGGREGPPPPPPCGPPTIIRGF